MSGPDLQLSVHNSPGTFEFGGKDPFCLMSRQKMPTYPRLFPGRFWHGICPYNTCLYSPFVILPFFHKIVIKPAPETQAEKKTKAPLPFLTSGRLVGAQSPDALFSKAYPVNRLRPSPRQSNAPQAFMQPIRPPPVPPNLPHRPNSQAKSPTQRQPEPHPNQSAPPPTPRQSQSTSSGTAAA